jgi:hypothetical protein
MKINLGIVALIFVGWACQVRKQSTVRSIGEEQDPVEMEPKHDKTYKLKDKMAKADLAEVTKEQRIDYIKNAVIWTKPEREKVIKKQLYPKKLSKLDLTKELVCKFYEPKGFDDAPGGLSPKFLCDVPDPMDSSKVNTLKFKYSPVFPGAEFQFEPMTGSASSDLLRLFGYYADNETPVTVKCLGCPSPTGKNDPDVDPWKVTVGKRSGKVVNYTPQNITYNYASMEVKPPMYPILASQKSFWCQFTGKMGMSQCEGWSFEELFKHLPDDPAKKAAAAIQREGLVILMALIQHTDNKAGNQRLGCPYDKAEKDALGKFFCKEPVLMVQDAGRVFGSGKFATKVSLKPTRLFGIVPFVTVSGPVGTFSAVDYEAWKGVSVWKETGPNKCILQVGGSVSGTLFNIQVSKAGIDFVTGIIDGNPHFKEDITNIFEKNGFGQVYDRIQKHLDAGGMVLTSEKEYLTKREVPPSDWTSTFLDKVSKLKEKSGSCMPHPLAIDADDRANFSKNFLAIHFDTHRMSDNERDALGRASDPDVTGDTFGGDFWDSEEPN